MYSNLKTYLILFGGVFALSTSAIFVKLADAPSGVTAFYRLFLAALALLPFLLFRNLDSIQIIPLRIFRFHRMQSSQNANIFTDLFYRNSQKLFHIRTDVIGLICFGIQHQKNIIHIH